MLANKVSRFFIALGMAVGAYLFTYILSSFEWIYPYLILAIALGVATLIFYRMLEPTNDNDD